MEKKIDLFKPLTNAQIETLQNQNPDDAVSTINEQQIQDHLKILNKLDEDKSFSILSANEHTEKLSVLLHEIDRELYFFREKLEYISIKTAAHNWLIQLNEDVKKQYAMYLTCFFEKNILHEFFADGKEFTIGGFRHINHSVTVNYIKELYTLSDEEKEAMVTCYTSFISYLDRISYGYFKRAILTLAKENNSTQHKMRHKQLLFQDWRIFLDTLYKINQRDSIVARCLMGSMTRITEVLNITLQQIDWGKNSIQFMQTRRNGIAKENSVSYPRHFMKELKEYVDSTVKQRNNSPFVFVTRNGKKLTRSRLNYSLAEASAQTNVKKVTPDSLKTIWADLIQEGINETAIMKSKKWSSYV